MALSSAPPAVARRSEGLVNKLAVGLEPTTPALRVRCSTAELRQQSYLSDTYVRHGWCKCLSGKGEGMDLNRRPLGSCEYRDKLVIDRSPLIRRLFGLPKGRKPDPQSYLSHTYDTSGFRAQRVAEVAA